MTIKARLTNYLSILFLILILLYLFISINSLFHLYNQSSEIVSSGFLKNYANLLEYADSTNGISAQDYIYYKETYLQSLRDISQYRVLKDKILLDHIFKLFLYTVPIFLLSIFLIFFIVSKIIKPIKKLSKILEYYPVNIDLKTLLHRSSTTEVKILVRSITRLLTKAKKYEKQMEDIERSKGWHEMSRAITHEISNFMLPIEVALSQNEITIDDKKNLQIQFNKIKMLLSDLRSFYKVTIKRDIELMNVVDELNFICKGYDVSFKNRVDGQDNIFIEVDRLDFDKVIINLIKNAKESKDGADVVVELFSYSEYAEIKIEDNGVGIDKSDIEMIFSPNFSTKKKGLGLGLAIIKKIVLGYNWTIEVESQKSIGTTFILQIPKKTVEV